MKKNPQKINEKEKVTEKTKTTNNKEKNEMKKGFFKKVWYSVDKIDKYSELAAEGIKSAIKYLAILMLIIGLISSAATIYKTNLKVKEIAKYIDEKAPELTYKDGTLTVDSSDTITDENENFGKVIIDTNTDDEQKINQYVNDANEENAVIILKNKLILKEANVSGTTNYNYKDLFGELGITEFNKADLVKYLSGNTMAKLYLNLFLILFIYAFAMYLINTLFYVVLISIIGHLSTMILRLKIRYVAIFNMGIYAITLSTILNMIYIGLNAFYPYRIGYFEVMYVLIASIYMIAAVFILKTEFDKKQGQVQKIIEVEKQVKEEMENNEKKQEENKDTENKKTNKKKEKEDKNTEDGEEPEGSNA